MSRPKSPARMTLNAEQMREYALQAQQQARDEIEHTNAVATHLQRMESVMNDIRTSPGGQAADDTEDPFTENTAAGNIAIENTVHSAQTRDNTQSGGDPLSEEEADVEEIPAPRAKKTKAKAKGLASLPEPWIFNAPESDMGNPVELEPEHPDTRFPGDDSRPWVRPELQRYECNVGNRIDRAVERIRATPGKKYISDYSVFSQICDKEQGVMPLSAYMAADALINLVPGKEYDVFWTKSGGYERSIRLRFWQTLLLEDQRGDKHVLRLAKHVRPHPTNPGGTQFWAMAVRWVLSCPMTGHPLLHGVVRSAIYNLRRQAETTETPFLDDQYGGERLAQLWAAHNIILNVKASAWSLLESGELANIRREWLFFLKDIWKDGGSYLADLFTSADLAEKGKFVPIVRWQRYGGACHRLEWDDVSLPFPVIVLSNVLQSIHAEMGENDLPDDDELDLLDGQRYPRVPSNIPKGWQTIVTRTIERVVAYMEGPGQNQTREEDRTSEYMDSEPGKPDETNTALLLDVSGKQNDLIAMQKEILTRMDNMAAEMAQLRDEASQRHDLHTLTKSIHDRIKTLEDVVGGVNSGTQSLISMTSVMERRLPTSSPLARSSPLVEMGSPVGTTQQTPTKGFRPGHVVVPHSRRSSLTGAPPRPTFQQTAAANSSSPNTANLSSGTKAKTTAVASSSPTVTGPSSATTAVRQVTTSSSPNVPPAELDVLSEDELQEESPQPKGKKRAGQATRQLVTKRRRNRL
ncbi:hypothetical protein ACHAP6_009238 [Verticillium nonalfalfae]